MNKVFKVIWSEARNAYVVVSEIAKKSWRKKLLAMLIATGVMTCASMAPAMAADPPAEALKHSTVTAGYNITVNPKDNSDGGKEYNVDLKNDIYLQGDDPDALVSISGSKGTIWATGSVTVGSGVDGSVVMDGTTATVSGLSNKTTAYAGFANGKGKAATEEQLKEISEVAENANQGWNLSTNGGEASKVAPGETVDFSGDKNINISNDGTNVKVKLNDDIDVKSVQTNVLNAKYNLSVGTANENGTVPFFVNSNGAFYAANGKLVVDKDGKLVAPEAELGKVTADEGVIGNVVLKDGVFYKNSALRDGELFIGDADGNYSQITTKGAKLGKVTVAADGKISGVAAGEISKTSTDAINGSQLNQTNENVAALDKRVTANEEAIKQNADKINKLDNRVTQNEKDIKQNATDIAQNKTDIKNLGDRVTNVEELAKKHTTVTAGDNNITVDEGTNADGGKEYKVALSNKISVDSVTAGDTTISDKGLEIKDGPSVTKDGINAGNKKITGVADGDVKENSKDAVNGGQLHQAKADINNRIDGVENQVVSNTNRINQLGSRVNKVGAGAAALAALHPMDFDPDDKLTFSAGYGNYGGENAAAIGAYYRPDEKVMFSVGGTVGNGENMVNAGVSFSLDRTNHVSNSRTAMAREILDLRAEVTELKAMVAKGGLGSIAEDKMKIFPDVAENHWAYEYVGKLAAAGIIEGYPDGKFSGDRMMSRYEFAAMLYRAMQKGAQLDSKIINEFAPEMGRIRVDRISGEDGDRDKIERVRVNAVKGERDHYGNKLAK